MNTIAVLNAITTWGPAIIPILQKLTADIEAGKGQAAVTSADLAELAAYAANTSGSLYAAAGVIPPPPLDSGHP